MVARQARRGGGRADRGGGNEMDVGFLILERTTGGAGDGRGWREWRLLPPRGLTGGERAERRDGEVNSISEKDKLPGLEDETVWSDSSRRRLSTHASRHRDSHDVGILELKQGRAMHVLQRRRERCALSTAQGRKTPASEGGLSALAEAHSKDAAGGLWQCLGRVHPINYRRPAHRSVEKRKRLESSAGYRNAYYISHVRTIGIALLSSTNPRSSLQSIPRLTLPPINPCH